MAPTSTTSLAHQPQNMVNKTELYKYVLKIVLLEYSNETRFHTPIYNRNSSSILPRKTIPNYAFKKLKKQLKLLATNQKIVDEKFKESLLRLNGEFMHKNNKNELQNINFLISKFTAFANIELPKIVEFENDKSLNDAVLEQSGLFIGLLIDLIISKKDYDSVLVHQLYELKDSFQAKASTNLQPLEKNQNVEYPEKSYKISDMNKFAIELIKKIFGVDDTRLQQDVFKFKDVSLAELVHNDSKELIKIPVSLKKKFVSDAAYNQWRKRQQLMTEQVIKRYKLRKDSTLLSLPLLPQGEDYYVIPKNGETRSYFMSLIRLVVSFKNRVDFADPLKPILEKSEVDMMNIIARVWNIDYPTRAVALYSAVHEVNGLVDFPIGSDNNSIKRGTPVNIPASEKLFQACKRIIEDDGGLDWDEKQSIWSLKDQHEWLDNLFDTYNHTFVALKENLQLIFNKTVKPKFGPYLQFLGDYVESDCLFPAIIETGLPKKWEKRLSKTLTKVAGIRYGEYLTSLPRDTTLYVIHMMNVCGELVKDIKDLQKRYKNPLLGFLYVAKSVAAITTGMFASDAARTIEYIQLITKKRGERIPYADALELYQLLSEIRDIHKKVTPSRSKFDFNLEEFFFPYLQSWVDESDEKILSIVYEAFKKDDYIPIDLDDDGKRNSKAILDIFSIIKQYLNNLKKQNWGNEYQLVTVYTTLLKSVSNGAIFYSDEVTGKIIKELEPKVEEKEKENEESTVKDKMKNWLDEVRNVVSNIQNFKRSEPEVVYNFEPQTCIALNNISSMMYCLTKLEEQLDPESISNALASYNTTPRTQYLSHVFSIRIIRGENLRSNKDHRPNAYVTLTDLDNRRLITKTRMIEHNPDPYWDEEVEITIPPNASLNASVAAWDGRFGQHTNCGKTFLGLDPKNFRHNGIPEEIVLDLDLQGKIIVEVAVENETLDAMFVMGRAYRSLKRAQARAIKLIVEKFNGFISNCFSKAKLKSVSSKGSNPSKDEFEASIKIFGDYLNMNLSILNEYLMDENFMKVMVETWKNVINAADELMLPNLSKARINTEGGGEGGHTSSSPPLSSSLSENEIEYILQWLSRLCDFFHHEGNGPPMEDLKTDKYQSLFLVPVLYKETDEYLIEVVNDLSSAYVEMLKDRSNIDTVTQPQKSPHPEVPPSTTSTRGSISSSRSRSRAGSILRSKTINANATLKLRKQAAKEVQDSKSDQTSGKILKEDIILRILISRGRKDFVCQRLNQRAKIAYSMANERKVKAAVERDINNFKYI